MARELENTGFVCAHCHANISALTNGSYRNHCPVCLYSLHVDIKPGDRANACRALMAPAGLTHKSQKGWQIIHRCTKCGGISANKVATDTQQPDDWELVVRL
ncbi:MAG: RNHCP domain-containing protein [Rhodospirillales bacterium]|nr:RNHCP domain-containing protein [Rhodospirillales bacterium]MCB9965381.1 RNHCP domain-containing protein [Rhodospirillales bacterium]MCB9973276.1 RNHCP domain-containing protein [Rhodospirillales bacterium]MCB9980598.1 RNHCP domain-containing protein [Rhodospirillales bacterium]